MMNKDLYKLLEVISERTIAFNPLISKVTGSVKSGLLLSQFMYWWKTIKKTGRSDFWKTQTDIQDETTLSVDEIKSALRKLKELGFITITLKGIPAKNYFTLNEDKIIEALISTQSTITSESKTHQQDSGKSTNRIVENPLTLNITKTTSYITTDIKNSQKNEIEPEKLITFTNQYVHTPTFTKGLEGLKPLPPLLPSEPFIEVLDYFNKKTNSKFKNASKTIDNLKRVLSKHTVDEVKLVIDYISQDDWYIKRNRVVLPVICRPTLFAEKLAIATSHKNNPNKPRKFNDVDEFPEDNPVKVDYATLLEEEKNAILWSEINDN